MHSWVFAFSHPLLCAPLDSRSAVASIASRGSQPTSTFSDSPSCARREVHLRYAVFRWVFASLPRDFLRFSFAMLAVASMQDLFIASCPLCVSVCAQSHSEGRCVSHSCRRANTRHACLSQACRIIRSVLSADKCIPPFPFPAPTPLAIQPSLSFASKHFFADTVYHTLGHHSPHRVSRHHWHSCIGTHIDCARPWRS